MMLLFGVIIFTVKNTTANNIDDKTSNKTPKRDSLLPVTDGLEINVTLDKTTCLPSIKGHERPPRRERLTSEAQLIVQLSLYRHGYKLEWLNREECMRKY